MQNTYIFVFCLLVVYSIKAQENKIIDSTKVESLEEVVVTGQYNKQSVKKSVFEVTVIDREDIDNQAGNNLADLLNTTLNLSIIPNASTSKSGVSLFGLDEKYFKVLMDGIPIINEEGLGNNTDLTLINLDDIKRIEIVEGAMGVQYGANAVSGIINIITKKSSKNKTDIQVYLQEETVGNEYEWFDKGKHIQSLKISNNFTNAIFGSATYTRSDFGGFWDSRKGEKYDKVDDLRGHEWLPKEQHNIKMLLNYKTSKLNMFYKFDFTNETINKYSHIVDLNENPATQTTAPTSNDEIYTNNRFFHHLNADGLLYKNINYNISVSYQEQTKDLDKYTYIIREQKKVNAEKGEYLSRSAFLSRGTFSNLFKTNTFGLQLGYELTLEKGFGSPFAITINPEEDNVSQNLDNYDFFASSEIKVNTNFSFRPGARISFSNLFEEQYSFSVSTKYIFKNGFEARAILGSANRTPNYDELYTYFVDVNHDVQGNPNLAPEKGTSAFLHLKKKSTIHDDLYLKNKLSFSYLGLKDRIELIVVNQNPLQFQYNNIDSYTSIGAFSNNSLFYKNFKGKIGLGVLGISKILNNETNAKDDFLFNLQLNANANYRVEKWNSLFSIYFKYVGKQHQFVEKTNAQGNQEFFKESTEAYSWMDITLKKSFFSKKLDCTLGARNVLDLTTVETTAVAGGAHNAPPTDFLLGYGRSFFVKIKYNLSL